MELLFVNDAREAKVCDEELCMVFRGAEEEVLWFEVCMYFLVSFVYGGVWVSCLGVRSRDREDMQLRSALRG